MIELSLKNLLIGDGKVTENVKRVENCDVEPVVFSTILSEVLEVVNEGINASNDTFNSIEAV